MAQRDGTSAGRDTTARERERLANMLEASPDLVGSADPDGTLLYMNRAGRALLGLPESGDLSSHNIREFYPPEGLARIFEVAIPMALETGSWSGENVTRTVNGEVIPVSQAIIVHRDETGALDHVTTVVRDIRHLKQLDRLKSEFIATVSHELRTPLTALQGSIGLLLGGVAGELPEQATDLLQIARDSTERVVRLVDDVLDLENLEAERITLERKPVVLGELLQQAAADLDEMAVERDVTVSVSPAAELMIDGDRSRLVRVVGNLLSNAIKFGPAGGNVELGAEPCRHGWVRVWVRDQGPGVPDDEASTLFDKFHRLDHSTARQHGGTGLGLAIARAIVERHGGRMGLGPSDVGTVFWFELPSSTG